VRAQDLDAGVLYHPSRVLVRFRPGTGNINVDPIFIDPGANDFRLGGTFGYPSSCKNAGDNNYIRHPVDPTLGSEAKEFGDLDWDGNVNEQVPFDLTGVTARIMYNTLDMGA
jgi:hypothetical protein